MWAKDKLCFQHLVLNEMKRSTNADNWVAGMFGTETIEAWMQRRGGIEAETTKKKRGLCTNTSPPTSAAHHSYIKRNRRNAPHKRTNSGNGPY